MGSKQRLATYTNLDPGRYVFRVQGSNSDGVWNEEECRCRSSSRPPGGAPGGFALTCAGLFLALLWSAHRVRVRSIERHSAEISAFNEQLMKAQEQERTRIAGELHDSVMQQITALSLVLGTAKRQIAADSQAREMVADVQRKLIDVGTEVRELSHDLYPPMLKQMGLPEVLRGDRDAFSHARGIPVSCDVDESVAELSPGSASPSTGSRRRRSATRRSTPRRRASATATRVRPRRGPHHRRRRSRLRAGAGQRRPRARQHARACAPAGRYVRAGQPTRARTTVRVAIPFRVRKRTRRSRPRLRSSRPAGPVTSSTCRAARSPAPVAPARKGPLDDLTTAVHRATA